MSILHVGTEQFRKSGSPLDSRHSPLSPPIVR
jgi:hypothetical protein